MINYINPVKIIKMEGDILFPDNLLINKELQIGLNESIYTVFKNECSILLDFGKEYAGGIRILVCNHQNDEVKLKVRFGESISEALTNVGEKNSTNDHAVREFVINTTNLSDMRIGNTGFRYVYISKITKNIDLQVKSIVAASEFTDKICIGSFQCDDELINQIYETAKYTVQLCMQNGYIWDGVKRDRLVWIGDLHPEFLSLNCLYNNLDEVKNSLLFVYKQSSLPSWMNGIPMYSMWWLIILNEYVKTSKDYNILDELKDYIINLTKQICSHINDEGITSFPYNFIDWPSTENSDLLAGINALSVICLENSLELLHAIDYSVINEFVDKKIDSLKKISYKEITSKQIMALYAISRNNYNDITLNVLTNNGCEGFSTFMSYYILKAIFLSGGKNKSINLMKEYYGAMLELGATTFWEDFDITWKNNVFGINELPVSNKKDIHGDFGKYCYLGFRHSLCHGWSSGPVAFITKYIAGIDDSKIKEDIIYIKPYLGDLNRVFLSYPTKYGVIKVEHIKKDNNEIYTNVVNPKEIKIILKEE